MEINTLEDLADYLVWTGETAEYLLARTQRRIASDTDYLEAARDWASAAEAGLAHIKTTLLRSQETWWEEQVHDARSAVAATVRRVDEERHIGALLQQYLFATGGARGLGS